MKPVLRVVVSLSVLLLATVAEAAVIDAPHNESNGIGCRACHSYSLWWQGSPQADTGQTADGICQTCHGAGGMALYKAPHNSLSMGEAAGLWGTHCVDCHDPHLQAQLGWRFTAADQDELYLVQGTIGEVAPPVAGTTTFLYTLNPAKPPAPSWTLPDTWSRKTAPGRGLILVDDIAVAGNTFGVIAATETTITVNGVVAPTSAGHSFGLVYGQLVKKTITTPAGQERTVKFFDPTIHNSPGGFTDPNTPAQGVCQVCHTATRYWCNDGQNADPATGLLHNPAIVCTACHVAATGFKPSGGPHTFLSDSPVCLTCHLAGDVLGVHNNNCQNCHTTPPALANPAERPLVAQIVRGSCQDCHGTVAHQSETAHDHRQTVASCGSCHAIASQEAIDTLHQGCATCHGYTGTKLVASVVSGAIAAGQGVSGSAVNCQTCHGPAISAIHHGSAKAANNGCVSCHPAVNHAAMVSDSPTPTCIGCHSGTAGTVNGIAVNPADPKLHFACRTCHTFDAEQRGVLVNFTNRKGVNGSGTLPDGGTIGGMDGGGVCSGCHTEGSQTFHHTNPHVAVGECEQCHVDPRPAKGEYQPGDNGGTSQYPTQLACRECHVRFVAGALTVLKYTRTNYDDLSTPWTQSTQHTIPGVSQGQINSYGICFSCHGEGSATKVRVFHARPDQHDSNNSWQLGSRNWRRHDPPLGPDQAHYAAGRSSSGLGWFNYFSASYEAGGGNGLPTDDRPANGSAFFSDYLEHYSSPRVRLYPYMSDWGAPYTIAIPGVALNNWTSGTVIVLPAVSKQTIVSVVADPVTVDHAVYDGRDLIVIASNSEGCGALTATYGGTSLAMTGSQNCTATFANVDYPAGGTTVDVITANGEGINVLGYPIANQPGVVAVNDFSSAFSAISKPLAVLANDLGSGLSLQSVGAAGHGEVAISGDTINYTAAPGYSGTDSFSYTVVDSLGKTSQATVALTVAINQAPVVAADAYTVAAGGGAVVCNVLDNDTDSDADPLTITTLSPPAVGTAVVDGATILYTPPAAGFDGDTQLSYQVSDGMGHTVSGEVTITVATPRDWVTVLDPWPLMPPWTRVWEPSTFGPDGYTHLPTGPHFTVAPGLNRLLLLAITVHASGSSGTKDLVVATYGGKALTKAYIAQTSPNYSTYLGYLREADLAAATGDEVNVALATGYNSVTISLASYSNVNQDSPLSFAGGNAFTTSAPFPVIDPATAPIPVHSGQYALYNWHTASCVSRVSDSEGYVEAMEYIFTNDPVSLGVASKLITVDGTTNPLITNSGCGTYGTASFVVVNNVSGLSAVVDTDQDGVAEPLDQCPNTAKGLTVNSGGCALSQLDSDNDTLTDDLDQCPGTPAGQAIDSNGCSVSQLTDSDGDGVFDATDRCPDTPANEPIDGEGCSLLSQTDADHDGVYDSLDLCPNTLAGQSVNSTGCTFVESYRLPDSGQTASYTTVFGEDHDYLLNAPAYAATLDTVTDQNTGLTWQQQDDNTVRTWNDANAYCSGLALAGQVDWRLPSKQELATIVDLGRVTPLPVSGPAIDPVFSGAHPAGYWSATPYVNSLPGYLKAWMVDFANGSLNLPYLGATNYVRCVRGG